MRVSYVGGPKDGKTETIVDPPERFWVNSPDGERCLYALRRFSGTSNPANARDGYHKIFAPTDMSLERFDELVRGLDLSK
ncbi:MAG: hypothetical protein ABI846_04510 [Rudaea sp.]